MLFVVVVVAISIWWLAFFMLFQFITTVFLVFIYFWQTKLHSDRCSAWALLIKI